MRKLLCNNDHSTTSFRAVIVDSETNQHITKRSSGGEPGCHRLMRQITSLVEMVEPIMKNKTTKHIEKLTPLQKSA